MANIQFNPALMTNAQNTFLLQTQGYIQGLTQDDPVSRMLLRAGLVGAGVTQPVWGGLAIAANVGGLNPSGQSVPTIIPATTTQLNGFTVFDQAINVTQTPGNTVPVAVAGQNMPFYFFGSNASIPLPVASGVFAALETASTSIPLYWDTVALNITTTVNANTIALPANVDVLDVNATSKMVSYNSSTGAVTWVSGQDAILIKI